MNKLFVFLAPALTLVFCAILFLPIRIGPSVLERQTQPITGRTTGLIADNQVAQPKAPALLSPAQVALLFPTSAPHAEKPIEPSIMVEPEIPLASWLKSLGTIKDTQGVERLYFKDMRIGSILKFRSDGIEENGYRLSKTKSGNREIRTPEGTFLLQGEQ